MDGCYAFLMSAMCATKEVATRFGAMPDDFAATMIACWRQRVDSALEAIKIVRNARYYDFQWFVVLIPANFTLGHRIYFQLRFSCLKFRYRVRDFRACPAPFDPVRRLRYLPRPTSRRMSVHPRGEW